MRRVKHFLTWVVIFCLALALLPLSIASANDTATVSINAPDEVAEGGNFTANVTVDYIEDFDSLGYSVSYNQTIITVTDFTGGEIDGQVIPNSE